MPNPSEPTTSRRPRLARRSPTTQLAVTGGGRSGRRGTIARPKRSVWLCGIPVNIPSAERRTVKLREGAAGSRTVSVVPTPGLRSGRAAQEQGRLSCRTVHPIWIGGPERGRWERRSRPRRSARRTLVERNRRHGRRCDTHFESIRLVGQARQRPLRPRPTASGGDRARRIRLPSALCDDMPTG
jgi:hypothetical protein